MSYKRSDRRKSNEIRSLKVTRNFLEEPEGSVLIEMGNTKVVCTVSVLYTLPRFIKEQGEDFGWITAEYDMLPRAGNRRNIRDRVKGKISGRSQEIQRLIGRTFRAISNLYAIPKRSVYVDCDVIQADGGTRTAAINGGFLALYDAFTSMKNKNQIDEFPLNKFIGAISVGVVENEVLLDLAYDEDVVADVDMNIVKDDEGNYIEIQGTGEEATFNQKQLNTMLDYAGKGIDDVIKYQKNLIMKDL
ncbi:MAG: ribonuclease PH [Candidatus Cloacimonetes bacterium]|nr:ribonuclease PH [Candidatus Cloacimonadota bacterium]MBS3768054.1 ribonuclease PH [Candidatus Cloacimonadota bacterium]